MSRNNHLYIPGLPELLLLLFAIPGSCFSQTKGFQITGSVSGFKDSTLIYLYENKTTHKADLIDSAFIIDNQFHFTGSLKAHVVQAILETKDPSNYKYFWLENAAIRFTAENGKLRDAVITGSKTQKEQDLFDRMAGNDKEKTISFIRHHPHSIISALFLSIYDATWGKDTSAMLYRHLSGKMKNSSYGKDVLAFIALNKNPKIGDRYVDFSEPDAEGKNIRLSDFRGKVVLLDFWGSWCGACRENNPELVKTYVEFNPKGFEILGVAAEVEKKSWTDAIRKDGLIWQNVTDLKGWNNQAALIYGVYKYPTSYLIDRNGIIIAMDMEGDALRNKLREIMD